MAHLEYLETAKAYAGQKLAHLRTVLNPTILSAYMNGVMLMILGSVVIGMLLIWISTSHFKQKRAQKFKDVAQSHRDQQLGKIDAFVAKYPPLSDKEKERQILAASVSEIAQRCREGQWKVLDVVLTYCHQAIKAHLELNCITEVLFEEAIMMAKEMDSRTERQGSLFGVPISVKDCYKIKGIPSSVGLFRWKDEKMVDNSALIDYLLAGGAIPICKTNVPQTMMSFECRNPLWGTTENPIKKGYSPGGSSGGDASIVKAQGVALGIGSDIGGSLRIPAHFSGLYTIKPSTLRVPGSNMRYFKSSAILIHPVNGPIARSVDDLIPFLEATLGKSDFNVPATTPFSRDLLAESMGPRKLKIGVITHLPFLRSLPPCVRAVDEVVELLKEDGHSVVNFTFRICSLKSSRLAIISSRSLAFLTPRESRKFMGRLS